MNEHENSFNELTQPGKGTPTLSLIHSARKNQQQGNTIIKANNAEHGLSSNSDIFFSGCFGPKEDNRKGNVQSNAMSNYISTIPFALNDKEKDKKTFGSLGNGSKLNLASRDTSMSNCMTNKHGEATNGSFLGISTFSTFSTFSRSGFSFEKFAQSVSFDGFPKNKKVFKTSEEILLEKIKKEKDQIRRLRYLNIQNHEKSKNYAPKPILPSKLTLIKPFNFSSSTLLLRKRLSSLHPDINTINNKIKEAIKRKCEEFGENMKENDKVVLTKTPTNVKYMRRIRDDMSKSKSKSRSKTKTKSPLRIQEDDDELQFLSSRIEKYCVISKNKTRELKKSKSPLKFNRNIDEDEKRVLHCENSIMNTATTPTNTTTLKTSTSRLGIKKSIQRKQPVVESFESVLMKTRNEKKEIDRVEKENKHMEKISQIKQMKIRKKENILKQHGENMQIE